MMFTRSNRMCTLMRDLMLATLAGILCTVLLSCDENGPDVVTPRPDTSSSEGTTGASLYNYHCAACHGRDGRPLVQATDDLLDYSASLDTFNTILNDGPGLMPTYAHFDSARRVLIYEYIRTFKR